MPPFKRTTCKGSTTATAVSRTNPCLGTGLSRGRATDAPKICFKNAGAPFEVPGAAIWGGVGRKRIQGALRKPFLRPGALVRTLRAGLVRLVARARARRRRRSIAGPRRGRRRGRRRRGLTIDRALARATGLMVAVAVPTSRRAQRRPVVIHAVHAECGNPTISCEVCLNARVAWSSGDERRAALRRIAAPPRRRAARERAVRLPPSRPVSALPPCCSGRGGGANDTWKRLP